MTDFEWDFPAPYCIDVTVCEDDIDGLNHANNAVYVKWCEQAGWAHTCELGLDLDAYRKLDRAMAIQKAEYEYLQAARLAEQLQVGTWLCQSDGKLSMTRRFQMVRKSDGITVLRGQWRLVCIAMSSGRPRRMPAEFIDIYGRALIDG